MRKQRVEIFQMEVESDRCFRGIEEDVKVLNLEDEKFKLVHTIFAEPADSMTAGDTIEALFMLSNLYGLGIEGIQEADPKFGFELPIAWQRPRMRSISVSDMIAITDLDDNGNDLETEFYYCNYIGWKQINIIR